MPSGSICTLRRGEQLRHATGYHEMAIVVLGDICGVHPTHVRWELGNDRSPTQVFRGPPYTLWLTRETEFCLAALSDDCEIACGWCRAEASHPACLVSLADVLQELCDGENATGQVSNMIPPGFNCERLIVVEGFPPPGNSRTLPPQKRDDHRAVEHGRLVEAALAAVCLFEFSPPTGYDIQRLYTKDSRCDEGVVSPHDDVVLISAGYDPVVSAPGYTTYYLNFLAGFVQSLATANDPDHSWVKDTWTWKDSRVSMVTTKAEAQA
jgi:5-deoxy-glucuronate isomerase